MSPYAYLPFIAQGDSMMSEQATGEREAAEEDRLCAVEARSVRDDGVLRTPSHRLGGGGLQAMLVGNGSAGVIVVAIGAALRVGAGGADLSIAGLRSVTRIFWAILVFISVACALIFSHFRRSVAGVELAIAAMGAEGAGAARAAGERVWRSQRRGSGFVLLGEAATDDRHTLAHGSDAAAAVPSSIGASPPRAKEGAAERLRRLGAVAAAVAAPAASQFLVYAVTLAAWPSIPGRARFGTTSIWTTPALAPYWFTFVLAAFNVTDCAARLGRSALERLASRLPPYVFALACAARFALLALIYVAALAPGAIGLGADVPSGGGGEFILFLPFHFCETCSQLDSLPLT